MAVIIMKGLLGQISTTTRAQTRMRRLRLWTGCMLLTLSLLLVTMSCLTACSYYKTYSGQVKKLDFTFEYPRAWKIVITEQYPTLVYMNISAPYNSETEVPVDINYTVYLELNSPSEQWAQDKLNRDISTYSTQINFKLISQEATSLDGYDGQKFECTYDFPASDLPDRSYNHIRQIIIIVPKGDVVYRTLISASQDEWKTNEQDIQHVLNTFRWK